MSDFFPVDAKGAQTSEGHKWLTDFQTPYDISSDCQFPDYHGILEAVANSKFDKKLFVSFNPDHVVIAKKLFPAENLIMRFYDNHEMMVIFPSGEAKGFIGIMPLKITEQEATMDFSLA